MALVKENSSSFTTMMDSVKGKMSKLDLNDGSGEGKRPIYTCMMGYCGERRSNLDLLDVSSEWEKVQIEPP